jgi:cytochrome c oxidase subunit 2
MLLIGVLVGAAVGVVAYFVPWLPTAAAEEAGPIDDVYTFVTIISVVIFALVAAVTIYAGWRFRAGPDDQEDGLPIHGHTGLEIVWTAIPFVLVTAISVYSGIVLTQIEDIPDEHRIVEVTSQQFAWSFHYPESDITSGELVLPVGEPVELKMNARDVIHSFWVPEWRVKQDNVPGVETRLVVTPSLEGTFPVVCTELCGLGHATMRARAVVLDQAGFERWTREQEQAAAGAGAGGADGAAIFNAEGCGSCHTLAEAGSQGQVGPNLDEALQGEDTDFIRESIANPNAQVAEGYQPNVMPEDYDERLSDVQLDALVEYLATATEGG